MKTIKVKQAQLLDLMTQSGRLKLARQKDVSPDGEFCYIEGNPTQRTIALVMPNGDVIKGHDETSPRILEYRLQLEQPTAPGESASIAA